jgi:hypothetical protein
MMHLPGSAGRRSMNELGSRWQEQGQEEQEPSGMEGTMAGAAITAAIKRSGHDLLGIYLNDHLAGATGGAELARRVAGTHRGSAAGTTLQQLAAEIAQDRIALLEMMAALEIPVRSYKVYAAWLGEKAGRLKSNGYLLGRSPLSSLIELELLRLGVEGKAAGWRMLRVLADSDRRLDPGRLDELISRARRQADLLEDRRAAAADQLISMDRTAGPRG